MSEDNSQPIIDVGVRTGRGDFDPARVTYEIKSELIPKDGKVFLGNNNPKVCRFCLRDFTQTTFKKSAHVIPEFMGNKKYFSHFECDPCNELFGKYETDLASYGGVLNTFSMVKGKNGYPKHKGKIEGTETFVENGKLRIRIHNPKSKDSVKSVQYDEKTGYMTFRTTKHSYVPLNAFKALTKIGLCLLDENEMRDYDLTRRWLLGEPALDIAWQKPFLQVFQRTSGNVFPHPWAVLLRKRSQWTTDTFPTHSVLIVYGMFKFQIFLPGNIHDQWMLKGREINLSIANEISGAVAVDEKNVVYAMDMIDFSSDEKLINPEHTFRLPFQSTK